MPLRFVHSTYVNFTLKKKKDLQTNIEFWLMMYTLKHLGVSILMSTVYFEMHLNNKNGLMDGWRGG